MTDRREAGRREVGEEPTAEDRARLGYRGGLCVRCRHGRVLRSKTSVFLRCGRAAFDPTFPRYPGLPVLACRGFEERSPGGEPA